MTGSEKSEQDADAPEAVTGLKPEERGRNVADGGEAIEPEATHAVNQSAARAGDKMWGQPGSPEPRRAN